MNYAENNKVPLEYVKQDLQQGDMILFGNRGSGFYYKYAISRCAKLLL